MADPATAPRWSDLLAVGLCSGAAIASQLALTRVTSITLWHHFAFLVVGVALLGFGVAGAWLSARGGALLARDGDVHAALSARARWAGALSLASLLGSFSLRPNALELFVDQSVSVALSLQIVLSMVPFAGAGVVIGTALSVWTAASGRVYAADLIGGGAAAALAIYGLASVGALGVLATSCVALVFASLLLAKQQPDRVRSLVTLIAIAVVATLVMRDEDDWIKPAPTKELAVLRALGTVATEHRRWTPHGRIDVTQAFDGVALVAGDIVDPAPRLWRVRFVTQDGAAPTTLHRIERDPSELTFLPHATTAAVWALRGARFGHANTGGRVLVIGVGGGVDVMMALAHGAEHVDGVEVNPAILALHTSVYPEFTRIARHPRVALFEAEGRSFVRSRRERYDVIQLAGVDTFTALASGAYSLAEAHVYTLEAFDDYFAHLSDDGCLSVSRLILDPPRETLRLALTAAAALERRGAGDPSAHIAVVAGTHWGTLLACTQPIPSARISGLRRWAEPHGFRLLAAPGDTRSDGVYARALAGDAAARQRFVDGYPFVVEPATDEAPFFFDYFRWSSVLSLSEMKSGSVYAAPVPIGHGLQLLTLLVTTLLAAIGIVGPLGGQGAALPGRRAVALYFACLGAAFLFAEAALIERLTFFLGRPTSALAVVLCALLIASGIGAAISERVIAKLGTRRLGIVVVVALCLLALFSHQALPALLGLDHAARSALALVVVAALGVLLGMPFPHGLRQLGPARAALVPWAFGVNAFATVVAAALAPLAALRIGFSSLLVMAALGYLIAFRALGRLEATR